MCDVKVAHMSDENNHCRSGCFGDLGYEPLPSYVEDTFQKKHF